MNMKTVTQADFESQAVLKATSCASETEAM
jgi:hypothetical protein